jgi:hypothetical protein
MSEKQNQVLDIWKRYLKTLSRLNDALDEINQLKLQLDEKPKEVEVEKIVEVEANIDLEIPEDIAQLEAQVEQKLADNDTTQ